MREKSRGVFLSAFLLAVFLTASVSSLSIVGVQINPAFPNADTKSVEVSAIVYSDTPGINVASAELDYKTSDNLAIHSVPFKGDFAGAVKAVISDVVPKDGLRVDYQIKSVDVVGDTFVYPSSSLWNSFYYDSSAPNVSVSTTYYNNSGGLYAGVLCTDYESGCDSSSYGLYVSAVQISSCLKDISSYKVQSAVITGHSWVCAAAKDNAGNLGISVPWEFSLSEGSNNITATQVNNSQTQTPESGVTGSVIQSLKDFSKSTPGIILIVFVVLVLLIVMVRSSRKKAARLSAQNSSQQSSSVSSAENK